MSKMREPETKLIADLDLIDEAVVSFKLHGKVHYLKPLTAMQFFKFANGLSELLSLGEKENITADKLIDAYYQLMLGICDTITREDIENCTQAQIAGLLNLIIEKITGKILPEEEVKKKLLH